MGAYYAELVDSGINPETSVHWMQADTIWRHGEHYRSLPAVDAPFHWVPDVAGKSFVSLSQRRVKAFSQVLVQGLPTGADLSNAQVQFQVKGTEIWVDADTLIEQDQLAFEIPYLPETVLSSHRWDIQIKIDGSVWEAGEVTYYNPRPKQLHASDLWQSIWNQIAREAPFDIHSLMNRAEAEEVLSAEEQVFAFYGLTAAYQRDLARFLESAPLRPESQLEQEVLDDLLYLILGEEMVEGQTPFAPNLVATPREGGKCASIRTEDREQGFNDMMFESKERCRIQSDIDDDSFKKKATDKALDKIPDLVKKVASKWGKKTGKKMGSSVGRAITIVLETRSFMMAWNTKNRPKYIRNLVAKPTFLDAIDRGYYLEDGPLLSNGNCDQPFYIRNVRIDVESDAFSFLEYLIDNKIPETGDLLEAATSSFNIPLKGVANTVLADLLEGPRKRALDGLKSKLSDLDVTWPPCQWKGIHVPMKTRDGTLLFTLDAIAGSALLPTEPNGYVVRSVGRGQLGLKMKVTDDFSTENSIPCLEPYSQIVEWPVNPIRVELEPSIVNVRPDSGPVIIQAIIHDSYDHKLLKWELFDKNDRLLQETTTDMHAPLSSISASHIWSFDAPTDESLYPLKVCATSLSNRCGRGKEPVRKGESELLFDKRSFVLSPSSDCVQPGTWLTVTAIPTDPEEELNLTWEVVSGNAQITSLPRPEIELFVEESPQREVVIRATGSDGFYQEARYTVGNCLDGVQIWGRFETDFSDQIQKGDSLTANLSWMNVGAEANLGIFSVGIPAVPTAPIPGIQGLTSFGQLEGKVVDVKHWSQGGGGIADVDLKGMHIGIFRSDSHNFLDPAIFENASGLYVVERDPEFTLPLIVDVDSFKVNDSVLSFRVYIELSASENDDFSNIQPVWEAINGEILDTQRDIDPETDFIIHSVEVAYPLSVWNPQLRLMMTGLVEDALNGKFYGLDFTSTTIWNKIQITGRSRFRFTDRSGDFELCGLDGFSEMTDGLFQDGCCGKFDLFGYPRYEGTAFQTSTMNYLSDFEMNDEAQGSYMLWAADDQPGLIENCKDLPPVIDTPDPEPDPDPNPDPDPDPDPDPKEDKTPEALKQYFVNSPVVNGSFPPLGEAFRQEPPGVSSGVVPGSTEHQIPVYELLSQEVALHRFNAQGQLLEREVIADADALDFIGSDLRLIAWIQWGGQEGVLMQRLIENTTHLDFWGRVSSQDLWTAQEVLKVNGTVPFLNLGEFNRDGFVDLLQVDDDRTVSIWAGNATGFESPANWMEAPEGWRMRSIARISDTNQLLVGMDDFTGQFSLEYRNLDGTSQGVPNVFPKSAFIDQLMTFTDWNGDGVPDMIVEPIFSESFNVRILDTNLNPGVAQTYPLPMLGQLPGIQ